MLPHSSAAAEARLLALQCLVLELLVHVAEVAAAEDDHGAGGHGWVQAPQTLYKLFQNKFSWIYFKISMCFCSQKSSGKPLCNPLKLLLVFENPVNIKCR